jgi:cellulose synthase/poly-beta-1,6-N-acetylglucosamine synthase-like glycosyltransferase
VESGVALPFEGLAWPWQTLFFAALAVIVFMLAWTTLLFARAARWYRRVGPTEGGDDGASSFLWVFLVPALNEEEVIADSVERLLAVEAEHRRIVVIDDGSDDATASILAAIDDPDLAVITRSGTASRQGKAAALNHAWAALDGAVERSGFPRERVIVCVVDADGRLDPASPTIVARHFEGEKVGGLQCLVRIYNRGRLLTWMQDVEFAVYGRLYNAGRSGWGTAGMGGNGQFNRLSALDSVADAAGPWRDRLTEDQDLGLRLIAAGWQGRQELSAQVDQQGLPGLRRLYRQRTRWSQGNLQAMSLLRPAATAPGLGPVARIDLVAYLLMPVLQTVVGVSLLAALYLAISGQVAFWATSDLWQIAFFYLLGFGGVIMGCMARGLERGLPGVLAGILVAQVYAFYSWILWPVMARAALRQLVSRDQWAKTERESLTTASAVDSLP